MAPYYKAGIEKLTEVTAAALDLGAFERFEDAREDLARTTGVRHDHLFLLRKACDEYRTACAAGDLKVTSRRLRSVRTALRRAGMEAIEPMLIPLFADLQQQC